MRSVLSISQNQRTSSSVTASDLIVSKYLLTEGIDDSRDESDLP